jgi:hypothetical protein
MSQGDSGAPQLGSPVLVPRSARNLLGYFSISEAQLRSTEGGAALASSILVMIRESLPVAAHIVRESVLRGNRLPTLSLKQGDRSQP